MHEISFPPNQVSIIRGINRAHRKKNTGEGPILVKIYNFPAIRLSGLVASGLRLFDGSSYG